MDAKCPKCEGTEFEKLENEQENYEFVICSKCGCIVGCLDNSIEKILHTLRRVDETTGKIKSRVSK